jgi:phospholipase C
MLGWLHQDNPEIIGLDGTQCNHYEPRNTSSPQVCVSKNGYDVGPDDPDHSLNGTTQEIFGWEFPPYDPARTPDMSGFVANALYNRHNVSNVMAMFTKDENSAPIINTLATEFMVADQWFCSVPGPTDPNRGFAMSGTSNGMVTNFNGTLWSQQSIFDFLAKHNHSFGAYYQDDPWAIMYYEDMQTAPNVNHVHDIDDFFPHAASGNLSEFVWLQPRMTSHKGPPTWQHPDASVREGERLYKSVYEALRKSPVWNETAFVITYDEHGGFYDSVGPPQKGIPNPGPVSPDGFAFDRLGVRIPTVIISPWVPKGSILHQPKQRPTPTSQFDGTSVIATARKIFGITDSLTSRDAWAGTFEDVFETLDEPRTDCPMTLPDLPPVSIADLQRQHALPLNDHMQVQVEYYCKFNGHGDDCEGRRMQNQYEASVWIGQEAERFMQARLSVAV